jgi:hypothetical protein
MTPFLLFIVLPLLLLIWLFIQSKTKKAKWTIGVFATLFITFLTTIVLGLWSMGIEDLYGDKQNIFWEGSAGDTIKLVDNRTKKVLATGILKKTWHRINVQSDGTEIELLQWLTNETNAEYVETRQEIKDDIITVTVLSTSD